MRAAKMAAILVAMACGCEGRDPATDPDLHRMGVCDSSWERNTIGCEAACKSKPASFSSSPSGAPACRGEWPHGPSFLICLEDELFEHDGVSGCCVVLGESGGAFSVHFAACVEDL